MFEEKVLKQLEEITNTSYAEADINDIVMDIVAFYEAEIQFLEDRVKELETNYYDLAANLPYNNLF